MSACACGCGFPIISPDSRGRVRSFRSGHAAKLTSKGKSPRMTMFPTGKVCQCGAVVMDWYSKRKCSPKKFCSRSCAVKFMSRKKAVLAAQSPEVKKKRSATQKSSGHFKRMVDAANAKEVREKAIETRGLNRNCQSVPENYSAKFWSFRDPNGVPRHGKNLVCFVRENAHLFAPCDLIARQANQPVLTRAYCGLKSLRPSENAKKIPGSWKGWTWFSIAERRFNGGGDLLQRAETGDGGGGIHPASAMSHPTGNTSP